MRFEPEKGTVSGLIIFSFASFLLTVQLSILIYDPRVGILFPLILNLPIGLLLWLWFGTYYELSDNKLMYKSGPFKGNIDVSSIREIRKSGGFSFVGMKPALSLNGIIICYNKYDEIYISPKDKMKFIQEVCLRNPAVKISGLIPENPL